LRSALVYHLAGSIYPEFVNVAEATLEVRNRLGLHLRAASTLAQTAKAFESSITVANNDQEVSARSITGIIMLGAAQGARLKIKARGTDAKAAIDAIKRLFDDKFGEE
jgi:phosphotransferase system HPr (HPr) family protein